VKRFVTSARGGDGVLLVQEDAESPSFRTKQCKKKKPTARVKGQKRRGGVGKTVMNRVAKTRITKQIEKGRVAKIKSHAIQNAGLESLTKNSEKKTIVEESKNSKEGVRKWG